MLDTRVMESHDLMTLLDQSACPVRIQEVAVKIRESVERLSLDLHGRRVLTEAATGPYVVTPVIAAFAGADVTALTRSTRYGTVEEVRNQTAEFADRLGVSERIDVVESLTEECIASADIVTNSGHLRPLDAAFISCMKSGAVIPLMYESWEWRPSDVDLDACRKQRVIVAGTNERHPDLRVFDYLGILALYALLACRDPVAGSRILLICDNPFAPYIARTLVGCNAVLDIMDDGQVPPDTPGKRRGPREPAKYDAVVVATTPCDIPIIGPSGCARYTPSEIGSYSVVVQVWGDVDREFSPEVTYFPRTAPEKRHMGVLPSVLGFEPIISLQAGGLKVGQVVLSGEQDGGDRPSDCSYVDSVLTAQ